MRCIHLSGLTLFTIKSRKIATLAKAVYTVLGINIEGRLLGLYVSESEGANYWLSVLTDLHHWRIRYFNRLC